MAVDFNLISELHEKTLVLKTDGYINNVGGERLVREFTKYFDTGINKVIIDMENSKVVNSIGISYLIDIVEKLSEVEGRLIFTNLDATIEKTFDIMGLFHFAEKADSVEDALK